jgi:hypothetical protein
MDRQILLEHLAQAERHIEAGARIVRRQRELIAELQRDGHDAKEARRLLKQFEDVQAMHLTEHDRLIKELAEEMEREVVSKSAAAR